MSVENLNIHANNFNSAIKSLIEIGITIDRSKFETYKEVIKSTIRNDKTYLIEEAGPFLFNYNKTIANVKAIDPNAQNRYDEFFAIDFIKDNQIESKEFIDIIQFVQDCLKKYDVEEKNEIFNHVVTMLKSHLLYLKVKKLLSKNFIEMN